MNLIHKIVTHKILGEGEIVQQTDNRITVLFSVGEKTFLYPDVFTTFVSMTDVSLNAAVLADISAAAVALAKINAPIKQIKPKRRKVIYSFETFDLNSCIVLDVVYHKSMKSKDVMQQFTNQSDILILSSFFQLYLNAELHPIDLIIMERPSSFQIVIGYTFTEMRKCLAGKTFRYDAATDRKLYPFNEYLTVIIENINSKQPTDSDKRKYGEKNVYLFEYPLDIQAQISNENCQYGQTNNFIVVGVLYS